MGRWNKWLYGDVKKWERLRAKGPWRFILIRGALGWGISMASFWSLWEQLQRGFLLTNFLSFLGRYFSITSVVGAVCFAIIWILLERAYKASRIADNT